MRISLRILQNYGLYPTHDSTGSLNETVCCSRKLLEIRGWRENVGLGMHSNYLILRKPEHVLLLLLFKHTWHDLPYRSLVMAPLCNQSIKKFYNKLISISGWEQSKVMVHTPNIKISHSKSNSENVSTWALSVHDNWDDCGEQVRVEREKNLGKDLSCAGLI